MKYFARMRRSVAVIALAGLSVAGVIGFVHLFHPGPDWVGGLGRPAAVQHIHDTDPNYSGG